MQVNELKGISDQYRDILVGQLIALLRGYFHNKKEGLTIDTTSLAACADAIIAQPVDVRYS